MHQARAGATADACAYADHPFRPPHAVHRVERQAARLRGSDRALDRSAQLVRHWHAQVLVVRAPAKPEPLLADYAKHHKVDLVVPGAEGAGGLRTAFLGSTAEALVRRLDCDVMVVRAGALAEPIQEKP